MKVLYKVTSTLALLIIIATQTSWARSVAQSDSYNKNSIQINTKVSQSKLVQHGADTVFVDVTIIPPEINHRHLQQGASDIIIVLDRSGSMSEAKKMTYAKAAIWDVIGRLHENDRFALVSFANKALVQSPLVHITEGTRGYLNNLVSSIQSAGGTNMGEGLNAAIGLLENNQSGRARKILLLSDGQANQGITHPEQLAQIAARASHYGAVLSTIGMGLGFNESLMAKLADYGMGNYSYLEDLSGLTAILARDLQDTRNIYANSSLMEIKLGEGVTLIDAGGYPTSHTGTSTMNVTTGQILANTQKHFVMTFKVPTAEIGTVTLAKMHLNYQVHGQQRQARVNSEALALAILAPEFRRQAEQSIDKQVYQESWLENNLGRMKKQLSLWIREGKKDKAKKAINEYRQERDAAATASNIMLATPEVEGKLEEMEKQLDDAFSGSDLDQQVKRNRAAKSIQYEAIGNQRK
jgi:Ca-activated chloride channel family protein